MASLPSYVAAAKPVPKTARGPWYKNTAPTYAGIMLWFVFWQGLAGAGGMPGGVLSSGIATAMLGLVLAALVCHFLFYLVPGMLGLKTGLPLYVVGTSTYGVQGGFFMPGFLMGLLQFGWLGVNAFAVAEILCKCFEMGLVPNVPGIKVQVPGMYHGIIAAVFAAGAAFMGLKGIQYVARVATYLPLIPVVVLLVLFFKTMGGLGTFQPATITEPAKDAPAAKAADGEKAAAGAVAKEDAAKGGAASKAIEKPAAKSPLSALGVIAVLCAVVVGFFATAGAAGVDFGMNNRDGRDVQLGGLTGISLATIFAGGLTLLIVAGAYGSQVVPENMRGALNAVDLMKGDPLKGGILSAKTANIVMILLAISSFPAACFSAFIAANSFKTTLPQINPFVSVGAGTLVSIVLAVSGWAGDVAAVFEIIGASFGPVCGAMAADYLLAGRKWAGPRAGFNPAGWISWIVGFVVGGFNLVAGKIPVLAGMSNLVPVPPVSAFIVGFVLYLVLAKLGLESKTLPMPAEAK